jgi:hypothetical protein
MNKVTFRLQHIPPSTNNLYANVAGRGRVKSSDYRIWAENVAGAWCVGHSITSATLRAIQRASQAQIKAYVVPVISTAP